MLPAMFDIYCWSLWTQIITMTINLTNTAEVSVWHFRDQASWSRCSASQFYLFVVPGVLIKLYIWQAAKVLNMEKWCNVSLLLVYNNNDINTQLIPKETQDAIKIIKGIVWLICLFVTWGSGWETDNTLVSMLYIWNLCQQLIILAWQHY